jgi:fatty-acyl-CoA synthase
MTSNEPQNGERDAQARHRIASVRNPISLMRSVAERAPMRDAIVHFRGSQDSDPTIIRYADAADGSARFAAGLQAHGLQPEDVVAIIAPSVPEMLLALAGAATVAIAFPLNPTLSVEAMASQLMLAKTKAVVSFGIHPALELHEAVAQAALVAKVALVIEIETEHGPSRALGNCAPCRVSWSQFLKRDASDVRPVLGNRPAFLFHTGGTGGAPKLAELSLEAAMASLHASALGLAWNEDDRVLQLLPFFHVGGAFVLGLGLFSTGATLVNCGLTGARDRQVVDSLWDIADRARATVIVLVPATWSLVAAQRIPPMRGRPLRALLTGATSMAPELALRIGKLVGIPMSQGLGMTELCGTGTYQPLDGIEREPAVGFAAPLVETKLVPLFAGGPSELHVRGPMLFQGYRTSEGLINSPGNGWYASGDLADILPDGQLRILGRVKDVIIRSGHNIDPLAIEDVVSRHPDIVMSAAVGMPDEYAGELPIVYAVRTANSRLSESELLAFVTEQIDDPSARPKRFIFLASLPLTTVGKIARYRLRQSAAAMRMSELLYRIAGVGELSCEDIGARRVTLRWTVTPSTEARKTADAVSERLGIQLIHVEP